MLPQALKIIITMVTKDINERYHNVAQTEKEPYHVAQLLKGPHHVAQRYEGQAAVAQSV
jgi:hypothetical protein